jgi:DNA-binding LytR/AlgR family response regulator
MSGDERGAVALAWLLALAIVIVVCAFNVMTREHDVPQEGLTLPLVLEVSSGLASVLAFAISAFVAVWLHRARPGLWLAAAVVVMGAVAYFTVHVAGFGLLRSLAFPLILHERYRYGPLGRELPYEFSKDVLAYALTVTTFWRMLGWRRTPAPVAAAEGPVWFDIRDGARLVRAPIGEILAVRSAGNYVEFVLRDGRRPLMRSPLGAVQESLESKGFVRTHRSWLVNAACVTGLRPEGSGDYAVELGSLEAPLSRRFPEALAALRP